MAASSVDDVLAITGFTLVMAVVLAHGSLVWTLVKAPLDLALGLLLGLVFGLALLAMPFRHNQVNQSINQSPYSIRTWARCFASQRSCSCANWQCSAARR